MILLGLFVALATLFAAGFGATLISLRGTTRVNLLESLALSWLFGSGIISLLLWIAGFVLSGFALQLGVAAAAITLAMYGCRSIYKTHLRIDCPKPRSVCEWCLGLVIALEILVMFYAAFGHGLGWDGLLNWELKARYAFLHSGVIPPAYYSSSTRAFTHPGYPLLIPMTELWLYLWMGEPHQFWIKVIFPLYYASGVVLLASGARRLTSDRWPALLIAALLFFVPSLTNSPGDTTGGYVDVPLSVLYFTAVAYLLCFENGGGPETFRIFGASLALLPWAKREGVILWGIGLICGAVILYEKRERLRSYFWLVPGAAIIAGWTFFLRAMHATETGEFLPVTFSSFVANLSRIFPIARMVLAEMSVTTRWSLFWPCLALAFACLAARANRRQALWLGFAIVMPIALEASAYLFSNWPDYAQHFQASFPRLLLHVVPLASLAIALAIAPPAAASLPRDSFRRSQTR